jgi:hypothetical protein
MARENGLHDELVLVDEPELGQGPRQRHTPDEEAPCRLALEPLDGLSQIPAHDLRVPIDPNRMAVPVSLD